MHQQDQLFATCQQHAADNALAQIREMSWFGEMNT
jgi:hypothetical protein